jgi:AraC-like DNA-binding protein
VRKLDRLVGFTNSANYKCLEDLQGTADEKTGYCGIDQIHLNYCGMETCKAGFGFGPFIRTSYLIHVIEKGKGVFKANGELYPLHENQAFIIYPGDETYYEADKEDPWSYLWIGFNGLKVEECITNIGFTKKNPIITINCVNELKNCVETMLENHKLTYSDELRRNSEMFRFFATIIDDQHATNSVKASYDYHSSIYVKQVIDYISMNYSKKIKINELADYIGVNRSYLTNSFKREVNISPQEFLQNIRMDKASSLLKETAIPINAIALQVGYDDPLAFSKIFKQRFGVGPRKYRETKDELVTKHEKGDYSPFNPL